MAPITVAVESATTPAEAMIAASTSSTQNADHLRLRSAPAVMKSLDSIRSTSVTVTFLPRSITATG